MIIGLDFDNTIVGYEEVFHAAAVELGHIQDSVPPSKVAVRDAMRAKGLEEDWIKLQGYVYGCKMGAAEPFEGVIAFLDWARRNGHECFIVSHKTKHPFKGPAYDLHAAARQWIQTYLIDETGPLILEKNISFHETKFEKLSQISNLNCHVFIDDLPEILTMDEFPKLTKAVLFDPKDHHSECNLTRICHWSEFQKLIAAL